mmetsp:Transcript_20944/g.45255  ORF Transcript_20944/g.45255 Transcript_20944/m.45255 type:complete len:218 (+) Transcript_20944:1889-2542(+)
MSASAGTPATQTGKSACQQPRKATTFKSATQTEETSANLATERRAFTWTMATPAPRTSASASTESPWTRTTAPSMMQRIARSPVPMAISSPTNPWSIGFRAKALHRPSPRCSRMEPRSVSRACSRRLCPSIATRAKPIGRQLGLAARSSGVATTLGKVWAASPHTPRRSSAQVGTSTLNSVNWLVAASMLEAVSPPTTRGTESVMWSSTLSSATTCA